VRGKFQARALFPAKIPIDKPRERENIAAMIKSTHIAATYFWLFR